MLLLLSPLTQVPQLRAAVPCQQNGHENELMTLEIHAQLQALLTLPRRHLGLSSPPL